MIRSPAGAAAMRFCMRLDQYPMPSAGATTRALSHSPSSIMISQYASTFPAFRWSSAASFSASSFLMPLIPRTRRLRCCSISLALALRLGSTSRLCTTGPSEQLQSSPSTIRASRNRLSVFFVRAKKSATALIFSRSDWHSARLSSSFRDCCPCRVMGPDEDGPGGGPPSAAPPSVSRLPKRYLRCRSGTSDCSVESRTVLSREDEAKRKGRSGWRSMAYTSETWCLEVNSTEPSRVSQPQMEVSHEPVSAR